MKLKRLLSLAGVLALLLIFTGSKLYATNAIAVGGAEGFSGGSATVKVYVITDSAFPGAEITLSYDPAVLSYEEGSLVVNATAWDSDAPQVAVDSAAGTLKVAFYSLMDLQAAITQSTTSLELFSVTMNIASGLLPGTSDITPSGTFTGRTADFLPVQYPVTDLGAGPVKILSKFIVEADSVEASLGVAFAVPVYLKNAEDAIAVEVTLAFDETQLEYAESVEINQELWQNGTVQAEVDTSSGGQIKVALYSLDGGIIPSSAAKRWFVKVSLQTAEDAVESVSNPLTFPTAPIVATLPEEGYVPIQNPASVINGNVKILGKFSLRVSRDGTATLGGADTVRVYLKNADPVVSYEVELSFNADNYTVTEDDVDWIEEVFTGSPTFVNEAVPGDGTLKVTALPLSTDIIEASAEEKLIFEFVLHVKDDATPGVDSIDVGGMVIVRNPDFTTESKPVITVEKGAFSVRGAFELQVVPVVGRMGSTQPVTVKLTNKEDVVGAELIIRFDGDSVQFVEGSIVMNDAIWVGGAPVPEVQAGADSVRIGMFDLTGQKKITAAVTARMLLTLQMTVSETLVEGDTASIRIEGAVTTVGPDYLPVVKTASPTDGYFAVLAVDLDPPDTVSNVQVEVGEGLIKLTWENPVAPDLDFITLVRTTSSTGAVDTVYHSKEYGELLTSWTDTGLDPTDEYYYSFQTWDVSGNALPGLKAS